VAGLVVGKLVGISAFTWLACRVGVASMPAGTRFPQVVGVAALGGIGFTVSLFVYELAIGATAVGDVAKIGLLEASVSAAVLGSVSLLATSRPARDSGPAEAGPVGDSIMVD
jgi:NhaA family Na+:H+ antiporter